MTTDSYKLNVISREVEKHSFTILKSKIEKGVQIPFLAFLGLDFISGYGRKINFKMLAVSSVECDFLGEFSSVGINQTLHSIYINVKSKIKISKFFNKTEQVYTSKILLCETIIVGKVPEVYLNGKIFN
jgi:sporulation protein YunB